MQDSQDVTMSPISRMPDLAMNSQPLVMPGEQPSGDDGGSEESDDSESATDDEEVEVVKIHDNLCIEILDEDDSVLSPVKTSTQQGLPNAGVAPFNPPPSGSVNVGEGETESLDGKVREASKVQEQKTFHHLQEALISDDENERPESSKAKGVFKAGC